MSSSCIPAGLRLDLDMVKAAASPGAHSSPLRPAHSSPSSTLSEASNSSSSATSSSVAAASLSLKRARAPRKRPNQTYNEAAAVLASIYPSIFPVKKSPKTAPRAPRQLAGGDDDDLLPPLPVLGDAAFLLSDTPKQQEVSLPPPPQSPSTAKNCPSPAAVSSSFREFRDPAPSPASAASADEPGELDFDDDGFNADSMLDIEEAGIYGIMGNLAVESHTTTTSDDSILSSSGIHPYLRSLMVVGLAGRFELGLGSRHGRPNVNQALKRRDDDTAWWMWPAVPVKDITPAPPHAAPDTKPSAETTAPEKKKSKKKNVAKTDKVTAKGKEDVSGEQRNREGEATADAGNGDGNAETPAPTAPKARLGLKLDPEEVMKAWSDRGSMFTDGGTPDSPKSSADVLAKLSDIDLFPDNGAGGGIREASVMRYKEKRRTRLFSKKIRYQVRKVNADCRPRMKGRFVRSPSLLQQALEEET